MIGNLFIAFCLVAATVIVHSAGLTLALGVVLRSKARRRAAFVRVAWLVIRVACWLVLVHSVEIAVWALFFRVRGCFPDFESAFYFSGLTYTTVGYGDVLLPDRWRLFGPIEGLVGILMCGLSTGFFFVIVSRLHGLEPDDSRTAAAGGEQW